MWFEAVALVLLLAGCPTAQASSSPARASAARQEVVEFKLDHPLAASGEAVFVLGSLAELGGGDLTRAVAMVSADRRRWSLAIALPTDHAYSYRFFVRSTRAPDLSDPANGVPLSAEIRAKTRASPTPGHKALQLRTSLAGALLHWRQDEDAFAVVALERLGPGRAVAEELLGLRAFGVSGRPVEFFLTSSDGSARDPLDPASTYRTPLDACFLQDGELFSYVPAPLVGAHRLASAAPLVIDSAVLGQQRRFRVMLPRGYDEHPGRRYPVLYLYDGQTAWEAGAGSWDRNGNRLAALVARGEVGEVLQVAIDYVELGTCDVLLSRGRDCLSPEDEVNDSLCGRVRGMADQFLLFVTTELKPLVDASFRTLPDRAHTFATGYSFGGVFALYAGWEHGDTFGAIGAQSGSFWVPNFPARVQRERRPDLRLYLDTGDAEGAIFRPTQALRASFLLREGRVLERDLAFTVGYGQDHSFRNGGRRMESLMTFLWPGTSEVGRLRW